MTAISSINALDAEALRFHRGIEREGLRVDSKGNLARTPHPEAFGSKLCHPTITTDFSESQLELITPVHDRLDDTFDMLSRIHRFVAGSLEDEILWSSSMPCVLQGDKTIPLADYGPSNVGRMKKAYRNGLGNRYGRAMQTICAVHYNFSFPEAMWQQLAIEENTADSQDYRNRRYFDLMRNFRRYSWLPLYLFGASPAVCNSFVKGRQHDLVPFDEGSLHLPYATSLRSGNLGYQSDAQSETLNICYNDLENYVGSLARAVLTPYKPYESLGLKQGDEQLQLNGSVLQSEAEFYSTIRAKRVPSGGKNFLHCLKRDGVEYVEVRLLDLDPFEPLGIARPTARFLDAFLTFCLLSDSPTHSEQRCAEVRNNLLVAVEKGRQPGIGLTDGGDKRPLATWAEEILGAMTPIARHLDQIHHTREHEDSLHMQQAKVSDSSLTPSARILQAMTTESIPYFRFAMNQSIAHHAHHLAGELTSSELDQFRAEAAESRQAQRAIEQNNQGSFDEHLKKVMAGYPPLAT